MAAKKLSFEEKLSRLEEIVAALEKGDAPLADSLTLFEEGTKLANAKKKKYITGAHGSGSARQKAKYRQLHLPRYHRCR